MPNKFEWPPEESKDAPPPPKIKTKPKLSRFGDPEIKIDAPPVPTKKGEQLPPLENFDDLNADMDLPSVGTTEKPVDIEAEITALKKSIGVGVESPETEKEKVIERVLQEGGFVLKTHLLDKYIGKSSDFGGYFSISDSRSRQRIEKSLVDDDTPVGAIEKKFGFNDLFGTTTSLKNKNIDELIDVRKEQQAIFETIKIPGQKGFLGFGATPDRTEKKFTGKFSPIKHKEKVSGGSEENAVRFTYITARKESAKDVFGRPGKNVVFDFLLPESVAKILEAQLSSDPAVIREIIERATKEKILENPQDWESPMIQERSMHAGKQGSPIRPPYEEFNGRVYIQTDKTPPGYDEKNVHQIK